MKDQTSPNLRASSARIRCIVADDHALLRQGVRRLLEDESDLEVVAEAANASDALKLVLEHRPDLLLMDVGMPGPSSFEAARIIDEKCPKTRVIFLTMHEDQEYVIQGLQAGAAGYLLKDTPSEHLIASLREVHAGVDVSAQNFLALGQMEHKWRVLCGPQFLLRGSARS